MSDQPEHSDRPDAPGAQRCGREGNYHCSHNRNLFRYVISSNGGRVTDIADKKDLFQAMLPKETALSILEKCRGKRLGIASHMKYRYLIQGKPLAFMGRVVYGRDAGGVCCVRDMYDIVCKSRY